MVNFKSFLLLSSCGFFSYTTNLIATKNVIKQNIENIKTKNQSDSKFRKLVSWVKKNKYPLGAIVAFTGTLALFLLPKYQFRKNNPKVENQSRAKTSIASPKSSATLSAFNTTTVNVTNPTILKSPEERLAQMELEDFHKRLNLIDLETMQSCKKLLSEQCFKIFKQEAIEYFYLEAQLIASCTIIKIKPLILEIQKANTKIIEIIQKHTNPFGSYLEYDEAKRTLLPSEATDLHEKLRDLNRNLVLIQNAFDVHQQLMIRAIDKVQDYCKTKTLKSVISVTEFYIESSGVMRKVSPTAREIFSLIQTITENTSTENSTFLWGGSWNDSKTTRRGILNIKRLINLIAELFTPRLLKYMEIIANPGPEFVNAFSEDLKNIGHEKENLKENFDTEIENFFEPLFLITKQNFIAKKALQEIETSNN